MGFGSNMWFYNHSPNQLRFGLGGSTHIVPTNSWIWFTDDYSQIIHNRGLPLQEDWWFSQPEMPTVGTVAIGIPPVPMDSDEYDFYRQMIEGRSLLADSPGHRHYLTLLPSLSSDERISITGPILARLQSKSKTKAKTS